MSRYRYQTTSIPLKFKTKGALIDALEARRPALVATDKQVIADHKIEEKEALQKYREAARAAVKHTYAEAKKAGSRSLNPPTCPVSRVEQLDKCLAHLAVTEQTTFTIRDDGYDLFSVMSRLLTLDIPAVKAVC